MASERHVGVSDLNCWMEWKERCALGLCSPRSVSALHAFALSRFRKFLSCYAKHNATESPYFADTEAWHLFESHLVMKNTAGGKRYKDWLLARVGGSSDDPLDVIQGGATLIMRDVVREYLRRECSQTHMVSLDAPIAGDGSGGECSVALEDLLPGDADPAQEAELHEYQRLSKAHAAEFFETMTRRERIACLARCIGLSLAHPAVGAAAGCGKSMVNAAYRNFVVRVFAALTARYSDDDRESLLALAVMTINEMKTTVFDWGKSESACSRLFLLAEGAEVQIPG